MLCWKPGTVFFVPTYTTMPKPSFAKELPDRPFSLVVLLLPVTSARDEREPTMSGSVLVLRRWWMNVGQLA